MKNSVETTQTKAIGVDTNVFIYALDASSAYHQAAKSILLAPQLQLYVATKCLTEFLAVATKFKFDPKVIWRFHDEILSQAVLLYPSALSYRLFSEMVKKYALVGNRIFDAEIASVFLANGIETIATFNLKDFSGIEEVRLFVSQ